MVEDRDMAVSSRGQEVAAVPGRLTIRYAVFAVHREVEETELVRANSETMRYQTELAKLIALASRAPRWPLSGSRGGHSHAEPSQSFLEIMHEGTEQIR